LRTRGVNDRYIVVEHKISDPKVFWETARNGLASLPSNLKLRQLLPSNDGAKAVCLWEAATLDDVKGFVEGSVGKVSANSYYVVDAGKAVGIPGSTNP
jgi:hypothetical protein